MSKKHGKLAPLPEKMAPLSISLEDFAMPSLKELNADLPNSITKSSPALPSADRVAHDVDVRDFMISKSEPVLPASFNNALAIWKYKNGIS